LGEKVRGKPGKRQGDLLSSRSRLLIYGASLREALTRFYPPDEAIGIRNAGGDYNQLSTSLLQIENEFYGTRNDPWLCYSEYMAERAVPALPSTPSRVYSPASSLRIAQLARCRSIAGREPAARLF
jgi:hypothetical protein